MINIPAVEHCFTLLAFNLFRLLLPVDAMKLKCIEQWFFNWGSDELRVSSNQGFRYWAVKL